jgi:hypothetical protein
VLREGRTARYSPNGNRHPVLDLDAENTEIPDKPIPHDAPARREVYTYTLTPALQSYPQLSLLSFAKGADLSLADFWPAICIAVFGVSPQNLGRRTFGGPFFANPLPSGIRSEERAMDSLMQGTLARSSVTGGKFLEQLFRIGFLTAIAVAMVGWSSAIGWLTVKLAMWLMA